MLKKFLAIVLIVLTLFLCLCGCGNQNVSEENISGSDIESNATAVKLKADKNSIYGYYETDDGYFAISKTYYERTQKGSDIYDETGDIDEVVCNELSDGSLEFCVTIYRTAVKTYILKDGVLTDEFGNVCIPLTKDEYVNKLENCYMEKPAYLDMSSDKFDVNEWFRIETDYMHSTFTTINNLFATGKKDEAVSLIETNVFQYMDAKIEECINNRQYWIGYIYTTGWYHALEDSGTVGVYSSDDYPWVNDYFDSIQILYFRNKMKVKLDYIYSKEVEDTDFLPKENCVYIMNDYFIGVGKPTVTALWQGRITGTGGKSKYCNYYYHEEVDDNGKVVCCYAFNAYKQKIYVFSSEYFFTDL